MLIILCMLSLSVFHLVYADGGIQSASGFNSQYSPFSFVVQSKQLSVLIGYNITDNLNVHWNTGDSIGINQISFDNSPFTLKFEKQPFVMKGSGIGHTSSDGKLEFSLAVPSYYCKPNNITLSCVEPTTYKIPVSVQMVLPNGTKYTQNSLIEVDISKDSSFSYFIIFLLMIFAFIGMIKFMRMNSKSNKKKGKKINRKEKDFIDRISNYKAL